MIGSGDWVLLRKGRLPIHFPTLEAAKQTHDRQRFNRGAETDATIRGPGGKAFYCGRFREDGWTEITGDRDALRREREETIDG